MKQPIEIDDNTTWAAAATALGLRTESRNGRYYLFDEMGDMVFDAPHHSGFLHLARVGLVTPSSEMLARWKADGEAL